MKRSKNSRRASPLLRRSRLYFVAGIIAGAIAGLLLLPGCASAPAIVQALGQDTNHLHIQVTGPGYSLTADRN